MSNGITYEAWQAVLEMQKLGCAFTLDETQSSFHYVFHGEKPDPDIIRPLLEALRNDKAEAIELLKQQCQYGGWPGVPRQRGDDDEGTVIFPADTDLPFPSGKWKRLPDGRIEARLTYYDLQVMKAMREAVGQECKAELAPARI